MNEATPAANPATPGGPGQAAPPAPQGATPPSQPPAQGGPPPAPPADGQQGGQPGPAGQPGAPPPPQATAPPERYELRLPDGGPLDQTDIDRVVALAKTHAWSNEQAQETLAEMSTQLQAQAAAFRVELNADPELGGAHLEHAQQLALRVLDRFLPATHVDGAALRSTLNKTGYGNWKPLVRLLAGIGQAMSEDSPRTGATGPAFGTPTRSQAERLFGDAQGIQKAS